MADDHWRRVKDVLAAALERPAEERETFLHEACGGDAGLRREVESLIAAREAAGEFLSHPVRLEAGELAASAPADATEDATAARLSVGTRLGPYEVVSFLGFGGMGEVYGARDTRLDRAVAIKVLRAGLGADPARARRFEREALTISKLNHPHICALYDVGQYDGSFFLVMERLEGQTLAQRLKSGPLPLAEALACATQIADALEEAHQQGIVHRDLKPANVMLTRRGAKLLDFGIAKLRADAAPEGAPDVAAHEQTGDGLVVGTPQYMAPEQLEGKPVDARTDVFAFGIVLHEMVTGRKPGPTAGPAMPPRLEAVVHRCLARDPGDRWASFGELKAALSTAGPQRWRPPVWLMFTAAAALGVVVAALALLLPRSPRTEEPMVAAEVPAKSIAVLPFQNLSPDPENAYFADGMTEDILTQLAKIRDMKVIARTSVMRYKGTTMPVREIARELGVAVVLEGSVRRVGSRVRITGQLVDASTEQHLWAETYDREVADVFAIQSEVAGQIASALKATLTPEDRTRMARRPTGNMAAYERYVEGRALYYQYRHAENDRAIELFRQAVAIDPAFALAQAGLADALSQRYSRFGTYRPADHDAAVAAARKAIDLDPLLPEAHKALAVTAVARGRLQEALAGNRRAVELHEGTGFVGVSNLGYVLFMLGRFDEALPWVRRSAERDPTNVVSLEQLANVLAAIGETKQAEATLRRAAELNPKFGQTYVGLMTLSLHERRPAHALDVARDAIGVASDDPYVLRMAALVDLATGNDARARERLERALPVFEGRRSRMTPEGGLETFLAWLDARGSRPASARQRLQVARKTDERELERGNEFWGVPFDLACLSAIEGRHDAALLWLEKAYEAGWRGWPQARWSPLLDPLRQDKRFLDLMRRIDEDMAAMRRRAGLS